MKINIKRTVSMLFVGVFAMVLGVAMQPATASAAGAQGGGTKCTSTGLTTTISGLSGKYRFCSSIYQSSTGSRYVQPYARLYLPKSHGTVKKIQIEVKYCRTTPNGTSCTALAGTNATQTYNVTTIYNKGKCNSLIRGGTVTNGDSACQTSAITGGQNRTPGNWYLAQSRVIVNGIVVKTINSPALKAGN